MEDREIKFRAWDRRKEKMLTHWDLNEMSMAWFDASGANKYIVMQYTGLEDIDRKEIYEGDILQSTLLGYQYLVVYSTEECKYEMVGISPEVKKLSNFYRYNLTADGVADYHHKVIGNKYETPEYFR